jgi:hypothetical protein
VVSLAALLGYATDYCASSTTLWLGGLLLIADLATLAVRGMFGLSWIQRHLKSDVSGVIRRLYAGSIVWTLPFTSAFLLMTQSGVQSPSFVISASIALQTTIILFLDPDTKDFVISSIGSERIRLVVWWLTLLCHLTLEGELNSYSAVFRGTLVVVGLILASEHEARRHISDSSKSRRVSVALAALGCSLLCAGLKGSESAKDVQEIAVTSVIMMVAAVFIANTSGLHPVTAAVVTFFVACCGDRFRYLWILSFLSCRRME